VVAPDLIDWLGSLRNNSPLHELIWPRIPFLFNEWADWCGHPGSTSRGPAGWKSRRDSNRWRN